MAYCRNCGTKLVEGAKFCQKCGCPTKESNTERTPRQQEFAGRIYKCPNCGEVLESFCAVCPACGQEIRDSHVSETVREFTDKLERARTLDQKVELIRSFPVANNKEDIFEFIILASTNITNDMHRDLYKAWISKFEQCYQKAKVMFENTEDFENVQKIYEMTQKKIKKENIAQGAKSAQRTIVKTSGVISNMLTVTLTNVGVFAGIFFLIWAINVNRAYENSSMHELIGVILLIASAAILLRRGAHLYEYVITGFGGGLSIFFGEFLRNGSLLRLGGFMVLIITAVNFFRRFSYINVKTKSVNLNPSSEVNGKGPEIPVSTEVVKVPLSAFLYSEKNYGVVVALFEHAGFTNIRTVPLHDLRKGIIFKRAEESSSELVASIHVDGHPLTILKRNYSPNSSVVISYHSFQN